MKALYPETYIITSSDLNYLKDQLKVKQIPFKQVTGRYKYLNGNQIDEDSLVVLGASQSNILDLLKEHSQESALYLDSSRNASLLYQNGDVKNIGEFVSVDKNTALAASAYTFDKTYNTYWVVK